MVEDPDNLMLIFLRRLDMKMDRLDQGVEDLRHRMTAVEIQVGQFASAEASHYASLAVRLDAIEGRLHRLERHADIVPA